MSADAETPRPALPKVRNLPKLGYVDDKRADRRFTRYKRHKPMPATVDNEYDPDGEAAIFEFLRDNPDFIDKPATMETFIDGKQYLNLSKTIRPAVKDALIEIFGDDVSGKVISKHRRAVFTGAIGVGKSTLASIAMCYMLHWTLCLKDPQEFFGLMPGSRIAFMIMSITDTQAKEVMFGDVKARITSSPWFIQNAPWDTTRKNQLRFPKDIWVLPGNSKETSFEGFNVLCLDRETEILTATGWKKYHQLTVGEPVLTLNHDSGLSEWKPLQRINVFDGPDEMVLMEGNEFSALATDGHRWPTVNRQGTRRWKTTATLNTEDRIPIAAVSGDRPTDPKYTDALVEAIAWFYTEGARVGKSGAVIYQKHGTKSCDRIRACLTALFGPPVQRFQSTSSASTGPMWRENINNSPDARHGGPKGLAEFRLNRDAGAVLLEHAPNKVPSHEFLRSLTQAQLDMFLEVSLVADNRGPGVFAQKRHELAEAFAFAAILAGHAVSIRPQYQPCKRKDGTVDGYDMLSVRLMKKRQINPVKASRQKAAKCTITRVPHDDIVWCPTVENSTWLARRHGSVYFTGNCGVIDEGDSHQVTDHKDYAQAGYETIENRITSRFPAPDHEGGHLGLLLVIGQMKSSTGFMSRMYKEMLEDPFAAAIHLKQWESFGWQKYRKNGRYDVFWFDTQTYQEVSAAYARDMKSDKIIPIPNEYRKPFEINPVKALRDLAGIPPEAQDPFIAVYERVESAMQRWHENHPDIEQPVSASCTNPEFSPLLVAPDSLKRVLHIDLAYSGGKRADSLGMAMGYVDRIIDLDGDDKPYIVFDFLMRLRAKPGSQIMLSEVRRLIYQLKEERGFRIVQVTVDGTNSVDMIQTLNRRHITANYLSVDKNRTPYEDLREAIYEKRIEFPAYVTETRPGAAETVVIAAHELKHLEDTGKKIDHAPNLSKDVADAMAAVVHLLTGSQQYRRGARRLGGDAREEVLEHFGSGYDPTIHKAMQPIDVDFFDESGELQRALGVSRPKVPRGLPELEADPFGRLGLPRNI